MENLYIVLGVIGYLAMFGLTLGLLERGKNSLGESVGWAAVWPITWTMLIVGLIVCGPAYLLYTIAKGRD